MRCAKCWKAQVTRSWKPRTEPWRFVGGGSTPTSRLDGFEVIQEIRQLAPNTKVIAISGHSQVVKIPYLDVAKRLGAVRTIAKPFTMETLLNAVRAALDEDHSPGTVN
jgi:DNA-binding NtrC family response regulator